ncbi:MAG: ATP-binding protein [bacterium]|nr:ATP-binding protein [bacterium]
MPNEKIINFRPKIKFTLGFKFVAALMVVLIPLMLLIGFIIIKQVKQVVTDDISKKSKNYASFLAKVSRQGIKEADVAILKRYVQEISGDKDVLYILLVDTKNKPIIHSEKKADNFNSALEVQIPIFYKSERTGTIKIWYSLSRVAEELTTNVQQVLFLVVVLGIILLGLVMFVVSEQMIFNRIGKLLKAMRRVQKGDLSTRVEKLGNDELGYLAGQFNQMVTQVEENQQQLTLLFEMSRAVTAALDITLIMDLVLEMSVEKLQGTSCSIFLVGDSGLFKMRGARGLSTSFVNANGIALLEDMAQKALLYNEPLVIRDFNLSPGNLSALLIQEQIAVMVNIPLLIGDRKLGVLNINSHNPEAFPPERVELLMAFARQLAVVLQNAQLYEQTQQFSKELEEKINIATGNLARANERLKLANEKLVELSQAKSDFIAIVSHELRSPLTSILGFTDLLVQGEPGALNATQKDFMEIINQNTRRLIDLINNLLNLSKIEAGKVELKKTPLDLEKTLHGVLHNLRLTITEKKLNIRVLPPAEPLALVPADENQLTAILLNLLTNAIKYIPAQGEVVINFKDAGKFIEIQVIDNGDGIEDKDLPHIFDRFYRSAKAKAEHVIGTGLGLAISKLLVEMHGGKIWVESPVSDKEVFNWDKRDRNGAKFTFTLPKN